jgi:hypothetical protein
VTAVPLPNTDALVEAAELFITSRYANLAMLHRKMRLDAFTAGTIVDRLEELGILGPFDGLCPREILVRPADLADALKAVAAGRRFVPLPSDALRGIAQGLVREAMPSGMPRPQRVAVAERVVATLVAAGWRPTRG